MPIPSLQIQQADVNAGSVGSTISVEAAGVDREVIVESSVFESFEAISSIRLGESLVIRLVFFGDTNKSLPAGSSPASCHVYCCCSPRPQELSSPVAEAREVPIKGSGATRQRHCPRTRHGHNLSMSRTPKLSPHVLALRCLSSYFMMATILRSIRKFTVNMDVFGYSLSLTKIQLPDR